jgi:hypothetical protein
MELVRSTIAGGEPDQTSALEREGSTAERVTTPEDHRDRSDDLPSSDEHGPVTEAALMAGPQVGIARVGKDDSPARRRMALLPGGHSEPQ